MQCKNRKIFYCKNIEKNASNCSHRDIEDTNKNTVITRKYDNYCSKIPTSKEDSKAEDFQPIMHIIIDKLEIKSAN